jgi:alpha-L-arabinofuranosidase
LTSGFFLPFRKHKMMKSFFLLSCTIFLLSGSEAGAQKLQPMVVDADNLKSEIQPTMWGIFFEDINFAGDGGIYAELVKNRSFEFTRPRTGWKIDMTSTDSSHFIIINRANTNNPRFARITLKDGKERLSITNSGFRGMGVKQNLKYNFSVMASLPQNDNITLRIFLLDNSGAKIGEALLNPSGSDWKKYTASFISEKTDLRAKLKVSFEGTGQIDIDMVSLFPSDTWNGRENGLRSDLVRLLADMKPGFIRFPGGCIVEGFDLNSRYQWKNTIGNVEDRKSIINRWNTEFAHRPTPDYFQSFGLGFYEYFLLAEDLGAEPLPIINCGMACQFNSAELVPMDQLDPYVQDALDLIEFANGSASTRWGKIRADMGHPQPFNMKYLGIGNEQWGPQYFERYAVFEKAIRAKFPDINLVSGTGPQPDDYLFRSAVQSLKSLNPQVVDEHYYRPPRWFRENAARYDNYSREGYRIFAGEYAAQSRNTGNPANKNNWDCALSEAAFMTGLERNADIVTMSSYAPLFAHVEAWQWTPDLIWFDNLQSYGTPSYYVQKLFSVNKGTNVLDILDNGKPLTGQNDLFASSSFDSVTGEIIIKLVNTSEKTLGRDILIKTKKRVDAVAKVTVLRSGSPDDMNSIDTPDAVFPVDSEIKLVSKTVNLKMEPYSFSVVRIKTL